MDIYSKVPSSVKGSSDPLQKKKKKKQVLNDCLAEWLPSKRLRDAGEDSVLKNKYFMLDAVRKKWKRSSKAKCRNSLSAKDRRKLKVFDITQSEHRFEDYITLHKMWQDYMRDTLDISRYKQPDPGPKKLNNERLLKADYHGCMIVVRKSKCPSLVGVSGIVLMETKNTFKIVTKENELKCIPKYYSQLSFELDGFLFTIHGAQFCAKSSMRTRKKFKFKASAHL